MGNKTGCALVSIYKIDFFNLQQASSNWSRGTTMSFLTLGISVYLGAFPYIDLAVPRGNDPLLTA